MATLGDAVVYIRANMAPLKRGLTTAKGLVITSTLSMGKIALGSMTTIFSTIGSMARSLVNKIRRYARMAAYAFIGFTVASIKAAADFEKQMAQVSTMLDEQTMYLLPDFAREMRFLSKTYGQSTATLTEGMYALLSAAIPAAKALDILEISTRTAIAGMTETAIANKAIITIINSYGLAAEDARMVSDKMFASLKRGVFTFEEMASDIGRVTSSAAIAGVSLNELLAVLSTGTRKGISFNEAASALAVGLNTFLKPTSEAIKLEKKLELQFNSTTLKTLGLVEAFRRMAKASPEELAQITPRVRSFKIFAANIQDLTGLTEDLGLISERSAGMTDVAYDKMSKTMSFKLGQIKQRTIDVSREFGLMAGPPVLDTISTGFDNIENRIKEFNDLVEEYGYQVAATYEWNTYFKPAFDKILEDMTAWFDNNKDKIQAKASEWGDAIAQGIQEGFKRTKNNIMTSKYARSVAEEAIDFANHPITYPARRLDRTLHELSGQGDVHKVGGIRP